VEISGKTYAKNFSFETSVEGENGGTYIISGHKRWAEQAHI
jgi:hypothetical protein